MREYANLKFSLEDRVALLTIAHPPVNTLSRATLDDLNAALDELVADGQVKVIIITGEGQSAFAAGADINEIAALTRAADADGTESRASGSETGDFILRGRQVVNKIESCPKPVIAAIQAAALGGGMELAMACHIRIMSDQAFLGQSETNLGIIPGWGGTQQLPRIVGRSKAIELILTGDMIRGPEALRLGLINKLAPAQQVLAEAKTLARKLAAKSRLTNEAALRAIDDGLRQSLADGMLSEANYFAKLIHSNDAKEGTSAFLQRRQPRFTDS